MEEYGNEQLPLSPGTQDTSLRNYTQVTAPTFSMINILLWYVPSSVLLFVTLDTILFWKNVAFFSGGMRRVAKGRQEKRHEYKADNQIGGSYATIPSIASRKAFRNWYQANYPYSFIGGRVVFDVEA